MPEVDAHHQLTLPSAAGSIEGSNEIKDANPQGKTPIDLAAGSEEASGGKNAEWSIDEEVMLVKHAQTILEPTFDASKILSLLPSKSEEEIKGKWMDLSSSLLWMLAKRKQDGLGEPAEPSINYGNGTINTSRKKQKTGGSNWTEEDLERLMEVMEKYNSTTPKWDDIASNFPGKTPVDCLTQWQCMSIPHQIKGKGSWTPGEDATIRSKFKAFGSKWSRIADFLPGRSGKQCRERWVNHLDPNLKKCEWSDDEEAILIGMHKHHGSKWTLISKSLPGRSDNDVKNHWYSTITRKFKIHGKDKLTVAAIQQVFMLVTAGVVSRDLVKDWPGAPTASQPPPPHPYPYPRHDGYHYGYIMPPYHQHHPMHPSVPVAYPQPPSATEKAEESGKGDAARATPTNNEDTTGQQEGV